MIDISNRNSINIRDKKVTIIGLGLSGVSAAKLANYLGARVFASDPSSKFHISDAGLNLLHHHISCETGIQSDKIYDTDLWIISPGIPADAPIIQKAKQLGIPIVGEIEFASWYCDAPIIAVTGSNGKTTSVHILSEMCQSDSIDSLMAGNVGIPFSERVLKDLKHPNPKRTFILEISSFQMEFVKHFCPKIALYTNVSPDHLDRHGSMDNYLKMKLNMVKNMTPSDHIVFNLDDPKIKLAIEGHCAQLVPFSLLNQGMTYSMNSNQITTLTGNSLIDVNEIALPGKHNLSNMLGAATVSHLMGIPNEHISHLMRTFTGVEHRLENVNIIKGVTYINDSKATNLESVIVALESFKNPIVLILGGRNKGADFRLLLPHIKSSHVRNIISYGEVSEHILTAFGDAVRSVNVTDLNSAVKIAQSLAVPGDIVLLSPGCASFDQFANFEERGLYFKSLVKDMEIA
jgi:UDP-N-acetylmuramoylalanine--D-glutamate ligase